MDCDQFQTQGRVYAFTAAFLFWCSAWGSVG
jgi:hypothetical protein